jgi:hypothetical protein
LSWSRYPLIAPLKTRQNRAYESSREGERHLCLKHSLLLRGAKILPHIDGAITMLYYVI